MSGDSVDAAVLAVTLKSGHSLCMDGHYSNVPHRVHPKSRMMTQVRSIPKIPVDNSYEAVQESVNRSLLHKLAYDQNPHVFKRGGDPDFNFSRHISGKHDVRNLLPDMHPVSDRKDICPPKFGYNFSKIQHKEPELRTTIVDFLNPKDVTHERKIGYAPGHIRTILQLDTFGPAHSDEVNEKRMSGKLPMSPNLDRNAVLTPDISRIGSCKSGGGDRYDNDDGSSGFWGGEEDVSLGSPGSRTSSINNRIKKQTYVPGGTWNAELLNATLHDKTQPLVRPSTSGYKQDARGTNKNYSRDRTAMIKEKELQRLRTAELRKDRNRQKKESEEYQRLINDFEAHLKSIQY